MYWQPGPAYWDAVLKDSERAAEIRKKLSNKSLTYLQGIVDTGNSVRRTLALRNFLKRVNPFAYGSSMIYEPYKRYEIARELLTEESLRRESEETLRQIANTGLIDRILGSKERLNARIAKKLLVSKE